MEKLLKDQIAIVTGGNSGIGKAISKRFAKEGAHVAIFGLEEAGTEVLEEIYALTGEKKASFYSVNVTDAKKVKEALETVFQEFGRIDIVVNNAGICRDGLLVRMKEEEWDDVMAVNAKSCYNVSNAVLPFMMKARRGKIINISSIIALIGNAGQANYAASKAAILGLTKSLAKEVASRNICVNSIAPGFIRTQMTEKLKEEQKEKILSQIPIGRMGEPEEVADMALFLASSLSDYVTGQVMVVDGGMVT